MIFGPPTPSHPPPQNFPNCREIYKVFVWCTQAEEFFLGATNNDLGLVSSCVVMMMHASTDDAQRLCGARTLSKWHTQAPEKFFGAKCWANQSQVNICSPKIFLWRWSHASTDDARGACVSRTLTSWHTHPNLIAHASRRKNFGAKCWLGFG